MPRLKSAIRRVRTEKRNRLRNLFYKSQIKTIIKKIYDFVSAKNKKNAEETASKAFALIDRAATKRVIHLRNAARKKSRISRWLKTLETVPKN